MLSPHKKKNKQKTKQKKIETNNTSTSTSESNPQNLSRKYNYMIVTKLNRDPIGRVYMSQTWSTQP